MLGLNRKSKPMLSAEELQKLTDILANVGLEDPDHWGFSRHVQNPENYNFGSFEWSERGHNMRYLFYGRPGEGIREAVVYLIDRRGWKSFSEEVIAEANRQLKELFGKA